MKTKKIITLVLAMVMCLSFTACGSSDTDASKVKDAGKLIVGITEFEPMDYKDENGNWIGFDAEMATKFAEKLGVTVEFSEIDWDNKALELDAGSIDCVWNGMTLTDEVKNSMDCSNEYCNNSQVVVLPKDKIDQYKDEASMKELKFAVEAGSAGEAEAENHGFNAIAVKDQAAALMEVASGTSDGAVIDLLMAATMTGEGTSYDNLAYSLKLNDEKYGVGFRKGSDLVAELNQFFKDSYADGSMKEVADKYKIGDSLVEQK